MAVCKGADAQEGSGGKWDEEVAEEKQAAYRVTVEQGKGKRQADIVSFPVSRHSVFLCNPALLTFPMLQGPCYHPGHA